MDQGHNSKFDEGSGQVFEERNVPALRPQNTNWAQISEIQAAELNIVGADADKDDDVSHSMNILANAKIYQEYQKNKDRQLQKSSRSLCDMAVSTVSANIDSVNPSMLDDLPATILLSLWRHINRDCHTNFLTWKEFSKRIVRARDPETGKICPNNAATFDLFRYDQHIREPLLPLSEYLTPLDSPSFEFITFLSISEPLPLAQLTQLKRLKNLGVLHIMHSGKLNTSCVDDRLIRSWSEAAVTEGAFPVLRVLNLWGHPDITVLSLTYASKFPALGYFDVRKYSVDFGTDKAISFHAKSCGWKFTAGNAKRLSIPDEFATLWEAQNGKIRPRSVGVRGKWDEQRVIRRMVSESRPPEDYDKKTLLSFAEFSNKRHVFTQYSGDYPVHWPAEIRSQFTLIGQLRNDSDLIKAGANLITSDQGMPDRFFVRGYPLPPLPVVSLHLGSLKSLDTGMPSHNVTLTNFSATFTRVNVPPEPPEASSTESTSTGRPRDAASLPTLRAGKKRRLDSLLNSF